MLTGILQKTNQKKGKTMATNSQVAHAWANKTGKHCRGSNFFYDDDTIYSYGGHFPIARHMDGVVLFTTESYSNSTSKHLGHASNACNHLTRFNVADVKANSKEGLLSGGIKGLTTLIA